MRVRELVAKLTTVDQEAWVYVDVDWRYLRDTAADIEVVRVDRRRYERSEDDAAPPGVVIW